MEELKNILFGIPENEIIIAPVCGHWNNDSGCHVDKVESNED